MNYQNSKLLHRVESLLCTLDDSEVDNPPAGAEGVEPCAIKRAEFLVGDSSGKTRCLFPWGGELHVHTCAEL